MKRLVLPAATLALTVGLAAFSGSAVAGGDHGGGQQGWGGGHDSGAPAQSSPSSEKSSPSSDQHSWDSGKHDSGSSQQPAPSPQPSDFSKHDSSSASTSTSGDQHGTKPGSDTSHWTTTKVGDQPDVSKKYGNGTTAADIAKSRGAPSDTPLVGPGNSQPHKVADCKHKSNKSGGVDVHAVKSYSSGDCAVPTTTDVKPAKHDESTPPKTEEKPSPAKQGEVTPVPCGATTEESKVLVGMVHFDGKHRVVKVMTNANSAHFTKREHDDQPIFATVTKTVPSTDCSTSSNTPPTASSNTPPTAGVLAPQSSASATGSPLAPAAAVGSTSGGAAPTVVAPAASSPSGGVLGAQATHVAPKAASPGGVLSAAGRVTGTTLPFTGLQLWIAVLIAAGLIGTGLVLRRRGRPDDGI